MRIDDRIETYTFSFDQKVEAYHLCSELLLDGYACEYSTHAAGILITAIKLDDDMIDEPAQLDPLKIECVGWRAVNALMKQALNDGAMCIVEQLNADVYEVEVLLCDAA